MLIFVAHDFSNPPLKNYRECFQRVAESRQVRFVFGDDAYTSNHLLDDIAEQIEDADLCLFDLTTNNFNVGLEMGLAHGMDRPYRILILPSVPRGWGWRRSAPSNLHAIPSDVQGLKRKQYRDGASLRTLLEQIIDECRGEVDLSRTVQMISRQIEILTAANPQGLSMFDIAARQNIAMEQAQVIVKGLIREGRLVRTGKGQGSRYLPPSSLVAAS